MDRFLIVVGIWIAGSALRSFGLVVLRKLGALLYLTATYFTGWFLSGSHIGGACTAAAWFLLPWLEIIFRVRALRLPLQKSLTSRFPPTRDEFPNLQQLTDDLEAEGFEMVEDTGWEAGGVRQFLRLLYHAENRVQASLILSQQRGDNLVYCNLTSRGTDGSTWTSTDYPFSNTMEPPPGVRVQRMPWEQSLVSFIRLHLAWVTDGGLAGPEDCVDVDAGTLSERLSGELQNQIHHNLRRGYIKDSGGGFFRYSWRGCFYVWRQFIKDLVRLA